MNLTRKELVLLSILACINFTHIMDFMIMMPMSPLLMRQFSIEPSQFGLLISSYSFSAGIVGFLLASYADKFDRKHVITTAYIGFLIGTFACAFAPSYYFLLAARILAGFFGGILGSQVLSIVGDVIPYERRGRAMSVIMSAFALASVMGIPVGLWLAMEFSWHAPFVAVAVLGLVNLLLVYKFIPNLTAHLQQKNQKIKPFDALKQIAQHSNQKRSLLMTTLTMIGHFSLIPFISPYLVANAGFSEKKLYLIYLVGGMATMFSAPIAGKITDRYGKYQVFRVSAFLSMIPILLITHFGQVPLAIALSVSALFFVFSNSRTISQQALVSSVVKPENRGGFMSINSSVQQLASGTGSFVAGMIIEKLPNNTLLHYNWVGYMCIVFLFLGVFIGKKVQTFDN